MYDVCFDARYSHFHMKNFVYHRYSGLITQHFTFFKNNNSGHKIVNCSCFKVWWYIWLCSRRHDVWAAVGNSSKTGEDGQSWISCDTAENKDWKTENYLWNSEGSASTAARCEFAVATVSVQILINDGVFSKATKIDFTLLKTSFSNQ